MSSQPLSASARPKPQPQKDDAVSSDDVARLEKYLTRENDQLRDLLAVAREESSRDHAAVRTEIADVRARVDQIASRLNAVEDEHTSEKAHTAGIREARSLLGRLAVNVVSILVGLGGLWFLVSDHLK